MIFVYSCSPYFVREENIGAGVSCCQQVFLKKKNEIFY